MVETWQVVVAASGLLVTVLTIYGGLIKRNYDTAGLLKQRLLGAEGDDTDDGFLRHTMMKLDALGEKMDTYHESVREGLQENRRHVDQLDRNVKRIEYKVDAVAQVVESEHDVMFRGGSGSGNHQTDGGQAEAVEQEREREDEGDE